jgi:hypothetical protein
MKVNKALIGVTAVAAMMLVSYSAPAQPTILSTLELSGKAIINDSYSTLDGGKVELVPTKGSFKTKDLIQSLNDSDAFLSALDYYTEGGLSALPEDTVFGFDPYQTTYVYAILPTGGTISLYNMYVPYYGGNRTFMYWNYDGYISSKYSYNNDMGDGKETTQIPNVYFQFDNYDDGADYLYFQVQGQMDLKWKAGEVSEGYRDLSVKTKYNGSGWLDMDGWYGTVTAKGKGQSVEDENGDVIPVWYSYWPFFEWWWD